MPSLRERALAALLRLVRRQPVRIATAIAAVLVAIVPGVLDQDGLGEILAEVITLLAGGEALRAVVFSPATVDRIARLGGRG